MSCQWREKVAGYVDDELPAREHQEFSAHLSACAECLAAVSAQMELKKAVRIAGTRFSAPPELRAAVYQSIHPQKNVSPWWKWALAPVCAVLLGVVAFLLFPRAQSDPMMAALVDQHVTTLASDHPVDVVSDNFHNVRPWYQGKLPFTFNMPEVKDSPFTLIGGKVVYAGQNPGAELLYQVRQHKISIFVFQAKTTESGPAASHALSFNVSSWAQGGLRYYLVTDANKDEAGKLAAMFQEVNRS
jgi:anti-sigma factor RsiW